MDVDIALPRYGEGTEFYNVTKHLRDANVIPIVRAHENTMLYIRVYEVECLDGHKASLDTNNISEYLFSQVDEEGNRFVIFN